MIHNIPETLFCLVGDFYAYKNEQHVQQEGFVKYQNTLFELR